MVLGGGAIHIGIKYGRVANGFGEFVVARGRGGGKTGAPD